MQSEMKNFFQIDNWSRQKNFILETIKIAEKYPLDKEKFDKWYYDDGSMSKEESEKIWLEFNKASVQVDTLVEYKFLLDQLGSDKQYNIETLAHENAHANKAEQLGGEHQGYTVTFIKKANGKIERLPVAIIDNPKIENLEEYKQAIVSIANAPEEYEGKDNYLSDGDLHRINQFK